MAPGTYAAAFYSLERPNSCAHCKQNSTETGQAWISGLRVAADQPAVDLRRIGHSDRRRRTSDLQYQDIYVY